MTPETIDRLRELLPGALGHVNTLMDAGWKQLDHARQVLHASPELLDALAARDAQKKILWQEIARLRNALTWYKDQFCEGFCDASEWADRDHAQTCIQDECSGCRAAASLLGLEDTP